MKKKGENKKTYQNKVGSQITTICLVSFLLFDGLAPRAGTEPYKKGNIKHKLGKNHYNIELYSYCMNIFLKKMAATIDVVNINVPKLVKHLNQRIDKITILSVSKICIIRIYRSCTLWIANSTADWSQTNKIIKNISSRLQNSVNVHNLEETLSIVLSVTNVLPQHYQKCQNLLKIHMHIRRGNSKETSKEFIK
jgi:hypothetical protein